MSNLRQAAQAVIERWDSPAWKDVPATAVYISALREALAAPEQDAAGAENSRSSSMTTPTLQDRVIAYKCFELPGQPMYTHTGTSRLISDLYIAVEAITKERDAHRTQVEAQNTEISRLKLERGEFSLDEEGQPDVGSIHQNIRVLKAAAKLALDASLQVYATCDWYGDDGREAIGALSEAINTLRQAGVQ